jgi:hypothetical protein
VRGRHAAPSLLTGDAHKADTSCAAAGHARAQPQRPAWKMVMAGAAGCAALGLDCQVFGLTICVARPN